MFKHLQLYPSAENITRKFLSNNNKNTIERITATGGTIIDSGGYRIHVFTSPGSFVVSNAGFGAVEYVVVAGGGGSQTTTIGGGGGAGGFRTGTNFPITAGTYPITVGGGGGIGAAGNPTIFSTITSSGGGTSGGSGGSGGGGNYLGGVGGAGNSPPTSPPQGNNGGNGVSAPPVFGAGGGGGASEAGTPGSLPLNANPSKGGNGAPVSWASAPIISPAIPAPVQPTWIPAVGPTGLYGGGGGGATYQNPKAATGGLGGSGGGGKGGVYASTPIQGQNGITNTGGGAGGGTSPGPSGKSGGSGIVIIRYPF